MASDRTFVTELATGLGMLGDADIRSVVSRRPPQIANLDAAGWDALAELWENGDYEQEFLSGFANGRAFFLAADALRGRRPRTVEWTGGRRSPGDEVVPSDLRIDHVYLVSCKYLSRILHNPSPARLVEGLLAHSPVDDTRDWYMRVAPGEYHELYRRCLSALDGADLPAEASSLTRGQKRNLAHALRHGWPPGAEESYSRLCEAVSRETARAWSERLRGGNTETVLWRLLRIGSAPYFILGTSSSGSMRLRIDTPWDWRRAYRLRSFEVAAQTGGQPRVGWQAEYEDRRTSEQRVVRGHVEIRWSHGRFGQPPEAKIYLDSPHEDVPGYHALERSTRRRRASSQSLRHEPANQASLWEDPGTTDVQQLPV